MHSNAKRKAKPAALPDNALARKAIETIQQIEAEAKEKKLAQLESLQSARAAILERIEELNHQLEQIDRAVESIRGTPVTKSKRQRRDLSEARVRVQRWMEGRRGTKFSAGDLVREFPELEGAVMSVFLRPLIQEGALQTDISEGIRRTKYYVAE